MDYFINVTIISSVTALIILLIKTLLKNKMSPKWQLYIWVILAIRILFPVFPESNISIFNSVPMVTNVEVSQESVENRTMKTDTGASETRSIVAGDIVLGERNKNFVLSKALTDNIIAIWLCGTAIMFLYMMVIYLVFNFKSRKLAVVTDSDVLAVLEDCKDKADVMRPVILRIGGDAPLLKGVVKPEIILPMGYTNEELKSVFTHELMHLRYNHVVLNMLCAFLLCVYWYNPIMWFCFFTIRHDIELLCDYRVLEVCENRKEYASVLLKTALNRNKFMFATTSMQSGKKEIKRRIKHIAYFKKPRVLWSTVTALVAVAIGALCLTNATGNMSKKISGYDAERLYKYKTMYVGDASKVGNLTSNLPYAEFKNGLSLKTDSEPYGMTINYIIKPGELSENGVLTVNEQILKNAAIIFCLVDNVEDVSFSFDDGSGIYSYPFTREMFQKTFNADIRQYSMTLQKFRDEFLPMVESQNWEEAMQHITGHDISITWDEGLKMNEQLVDANITDGVEKNIEIIMSSPRESSNPGSYIKAHPYEYENVVKMGDDALIYMLSRFEAGETDGLKAHIMKALCIDILGDRNNVAEGDYSSPAKWYSKLSPYKAERLPKFTYPKGDIYEQLVYSAALDHYSKGYAENKLTLVAPHIFGIYEHKNELKIFTTVYYSHFNLYGETLSKQGAGIVPAAVVYTKNNDGTYLFKEYIEAEDGGHFQKSIENFCKPRSDIAKAIMKHYSNYSDLFEIMRENIVNYLEANNIKGISLKESDGTITPIN